MMKLIWRLLADLLVAERLLMHPAVARLFRRPSRRGGRGGRFTVLSSEET